MADKICQNFRRETERLPASQELHSLAHWDFTPGNVIITSDKVMGIDITMNNRRPIFEDMTRFLADLTVNKACYRLQSRFVYRLSKGGCTGKKQTNSLLSVASYDQENAKNHCFTVGAAAITRLSQAVTPRLSLSSLLETAPDPVQYSAALAVEACRGLHLRHTREMVGCYRTTRNTFYLSSN